jgi:peptide/nickel transport system permease protein
MAAEVAESSALAEAAVVRPRRGRLWSRLGNRNLILGGSILLLLILIAILAPWLTPYDPLEVDPASSLQSPSLDHPFGTDNFGRDVLTRVIHGARIDLKAGLIAVISPFIIGVAIGTVAGFYGGWSDTLAMRAVDIVQAFPGLVLLIFLVSVLGPGLTNMYIAVAMFAWIVYARLIRSTILVEKNKEYVTAAKSIGGSDWRIVGRHVFPNAVIPCLVFAATDVALYIGLLAGLSYLGLGERPPAPEWGAMVAAGQPFMVTAWWISALPGAAIVVTGIALSLIGDGLGDVLRMDDR